MRAQSIIIIGAFGPSARWSILDQSPSNFLRYWGLTTRTLSGHSPVTNPWGDNDTSPGRPTTSHDILSIEHAEGAVYAIEQHYCCFMYAIESSST